MDARGAAVDFRVSPGTECIEAFAVRVCLVGPWEKKSARKLCAGVLFAELRLYMLHVGPC